MDSFGVAFLLLWTVTVCITVGLWGLWRVARIPHFVLGMILIYYFSLAGAWQLVDTKMTGASSLSLRYLEASLFPILIDENYLLTIIIYGIFNLTMIVALRFALIGVDSQPLLQSRSVSPPAIFHWRLIVIATVALFASVALIWGAIASAFETGVSAYAVSRGETDQFFSLHQLFNRVGLDALAIGLGVALLERRRGVVVGYGLIALVWTLFLGILGNRNELLVAAIAGYLWYTSLGGRIPRSYMLLVGLAGFFVLRLIEATRGWGGEGIAANIGELLTSADFWNPMGLATGSESLAAHMSLYGILSQDLEFTNGSSLLYLVNSLVPRVVSSDRIADTYTIYANAVSAPEGQGFTIHYAAACYLNFGLIAVIMGAIVLAAIWGGLLRLVQHRWKLGVSSYVPLLAAFCFCSAYVPIMMRGGPEGLKGLFIEAICIPYLLTRLGAARGGSIRCASSSLVTR